MTLVFGQEPAKVAQVSQQLAQWMDGSMVMELSQVKSVALLQGLCLCCRLHNEFSQKLREAFMQALHKQRPAFSHVFVLCAPNTDPAHLVYTLTNDFFLKERFIKEMLVCLFNSKNDSDREPIEHYQLGAADLILLYHQEGQQEAHDFVQVRQILANAVTLNEQWQKPMVMFVDQLDLASYQEFLTHQPRQIDSMHRRTRLFS